MVRTHRSECLAVCFHAAYWQHAFRLYWALNRLFHIWLLLLRGDVYYS